jgi:hypothetical protein
LVTARIIPDLLYTPSEDIPTWSKNILQLPYSYQKWKTWKTWEIWTFLPTYMALVGSLTPIYTGLIYRVSALKSIDSGLPPKDTFQFASR